MYFFTRTFAQKSRGLFFVGFMTGKEWFGVTYFGE